MSVDCKLVAYYGIRFSIFFSPYFAWPIYDKYCFTLAGGNRGGRGNRGRGFKRGGSGRGRGRGKRSRPWEDEASEGKKPRDSFLNDGDDGNGFDEEDS